MGRIAIAALLCASAFGQTFEAADVHVSPPGRNPYLSGGVVSGGRYDLRRATMLNLISLAWNVDADTVLGGPNWLELNRFDIAAKVAPHTPSETVRLMLQALLKERFDLAVHHDSQPLPAYALRVVKGTRPKLRESGSDGPSGCDYQPLAESEQASLVQCRNMTMRTFASWVRDNAAEYLRAPVFDATGLEGSWDFELKWHYLPAILPVGSRVTIFDAVEKQLGLTFSLETAPAPVLMVDHVNDKPTPNLAGIDKLLPPGPLEFEVADVKPSRPEELPFSKASPGGRMVMQGWSVKDLIDYAFSFFGHVNELTSGLPGWVASAHFDISAKPPVEMFGPVDSLWSSDEMHLMIRNLLVERFGLKAHFEDRLMPAYTLVSDKPKLKKADPAHRSSCKEARIVADDPRDSHPILSRLLTCQNITMAQFASQLQPRANGYLWFPVEDATGLAGAFDLTLSFSTADQYEGLPENKSGANGSSASDPTGAVSLFDAVSKQLGLKLEKRKRMEPILIIDHIEQKPLEN